MSRDRVNIHIKSDVDRAVDQILTAMDLPKIEIRKTEPDPPFSGSDWLAYHPYGSLSCGLLGIFVDHADAIAMADKHIELHRKYPDLFRW